MDKPFVWQMIKEAALAINRESSNRDIINYIKNKWGNVNERTIRAQIIALTVNHDSRIHYPENHSPRSSDTNSVYDILFRIQRGRMIMYNPSEHGIWQIKIDEKGSRYIERQVNSLIEVYTPIDIKWIKSVTNSDVGTAYLESDEATFTLHWPTKHQSNILGAAVGEIILIYQKINGVPAFTHLVTPTDYKIIEDLARPKYKYGRNVRVIAQVTTNNFIKLSSTLWRTVSLSGVTQGNACQIQNIKNASNIDTLVLDIWKAFIPHFLPTEKISAAFTTSILEDLKVFAPDVTVTEGAMRIVSHLARERDPKIIALKKEEAINSSKLVCEVCDFSFIQIFGVEFIECHHIVPIAETGARETNLNDLALVCANCHRMLHKKFDGKYLDVKGLRKRLQDIRSIGPCID